MLKYSAFKLAYFIFLFGILSGCSMVMAKSENINILGEDLRLEQLDSKQCAKCHEVYVNKFKEAKHTKSLETMHEMDQKGLAKNQCLNCHSADYIFAPNEKARPNLKTAKHEITCVVCHLPHDQNEGIQLRLPRDQLCIRCHTNGAPITPGKSVRHSQEHLFYGTGGIGVKPMPSPMSQDGVVCYDCHMPVVEKGLIATGKKEEDRSKIVKDISSHDFKILLEKKDKSSCSACHTGKTTEDFKKTIKKRQGEVIPLLDELEPLLTVQGERLKKNADKGFDLKESQKLLDEAIVNFEIVKYDKSNGFHNYQYAKELLRVAKMKYYESVEKLPESMKKEVKERVNTNEPVK